MFDASNSETRRGCSICRLHYMARATPDGLRYTPACSCEADAAARASTQALVDTARGALHEALAAVGTMLRRPGGAMRDKPDEPRGDT